MFKSFEGEATAISLISNALYKLMHVTMKYFGNGAIRLFSVRMTEPKDTLLPIVAKLTDVVSCTGAENHASQPVMNIGLWWRWLSVISRFCICSIRIGSTLLLPRPVNLCAAFAVWYFDYGFVYDEIHKAC